MALLVLATATACGGEGPIGRTPVATVNGTEISESDVAEQVDAQEALLRLQAETSETPSAELQAQLDTFAGAGKGTRPLAQSASGLSQLIRVEILRQAVRDNGGKVTEEQRTTARTDLETEAEGAGLELADVPKAFVDTQVELSALQAALGEALPVDEDALREAYEAQKGSLSSMCVSIVAAPDEAAAQAALDRIEAGEDFAAVSAEVSTDPTLADAGGEAGCAPPETVAQSLGPELLTAAAGDLLGPTETQGGWLVTLVTSLDTPSFEDARGDLSATAGQEAVQAAIQEAAERADVELNSRYGTWDGESATVVPPDDPGATTTTAPELVAPVDGAGAPAPTGP